MGFIIEDGTGKGYTAQVDNENRLSTIALTRPFISSVADNYGDSYTWTHYYDYDAADTVLLISNNSRTNKLFIHYVSIASDTTTQFILHSPVYPTLVGTVITGVNTNRISGASAEAEAYGDETGNVQANVLSSGIVLANTTICLWPEGAIVLGYHDCIAVDLVTAGTMGIVTIAGFYHGGH